MSQPAFATYQERQIQPERLRFPTRSYQPVQQAQGADNIPVCTDYHRGFGAARQAVATLGGNKEVFPGRLLLPQHLLLDGCAATTSEGLAQTRQPSTIHQAMTSTLSLPSCCSSTAPSQTPRATASCMAPAARAALRASTLMPHITAYILWAKQKTPFCLRE